jgi:uncharacterized protein YqeY
VKDRLQADLKVAMLAGDKRLSALLRDIKSAILNKEVAENKREEGLDDATILTVLKKEQKSRRESIEVYEKAGATERADEEKYQLEVIERYLPEEMSETAVRELVDSVIAAAGEVTIKDMGRVIGAAKQRADNVDGGLLARIIKEKLAN